jgi:L-iditol 2-dehydrogenase
MRAVRVTGPENVSVLDVPSPHAADGEVVVEVIASGVCSTDRKFAAREHAGPRTLGHEVTGRLPDGTAVGVHPEIACRRCTACRHGWHNRCPYREALGLDRDGGLAELVAVPTTQLVPLGDLDPVVATMLEPLACAVHAVDMAGIGTGRPAVVVGAGAMGILCAWVLQAAGSRVVVCQRSPERRHLARGLGVDAAIGPADEPADHLGEPPATAIVTAPGAEPLAWALERVAVGGVVHAFASGPGGAPVDANVVHYRHLTLVGSTGSRLQDYERARDLAASGEIKLERLPRRVVGLDGAPAAVLDRPPDSVLKTIVAVSSR